MNEQPILETAIQKIGVYNTANIRNEMRALCDEYTLETRILGRPFSRLEGLVVMSEKLIRASDNMEGSVSDIAGLSLQMLVPIMEERILLKLEEHFMAGNANTAQGSQFISANDRAHSILEVVEKEINLVVEQFCAGEL